MHQQSPPRRDKDIESYVHFNRRMWHPDSNTITGEAMKHEIRHGIDLVHKRPAEEASQSIMHLLQPDAPVVKNYPRNGNMASPPPIETIDQARYIERLNEATLKQGQFYNSYV
jgi:hypothetical protein